MTRFARPDDTETVHGVLDRSGMTVTEISKITGLPFSNTVSAVKLLCYKGLASERYERERRLYVRR